MPKLPRNLPAISLLREIFRYDPATGFLWNKISRTSRKSGTRADETLLGRYPSVWIEGERWYAHRIIWILAYGTTPPDFIDHIDGNTLNNRLSNLRIASHPMNMCNRTAPAHNTSGAKGVYHRKDNGKWRAYVSTVGKRQWLGTFPSFEEANETVKAARKRLHGQYAKD